MNLTRIIDIKERLAVTDLLAPDERDFVLDCINIAVAGQTAAGRDEARERYEAVAGSSRGVWIAMLHFWQMLDRRKGREQLDA